ncbi:hypothetical protein EV659_106162 [Rhodothalassium salexigens DSM 2132]|uniref:Uncharacterized protein n=1 Tax=Rhodothalassium salexigens DSM 2132 TaxID=1188247 RepID=A0A4R2PFD4_RHOSA|nr:hypothetical protein [Rhodothalassium salexigens]MBB4211700.1 CHASE2 domain-containing sensor protein [Rhodothalassium salexigens DSM 2132]MBK1638983.1 hypothetical protein [Rhodothalassium salexigens DSM 2132]TCP34002.1 hypothetical protein EV659_106162 [Rhodothalassium salexigens DSM 2132]
MIDLTLDPAAWSAWGWPLGLGALAGFLAGLAAGRREAGQGTARRWVNRRTLAWLAFALAAGLACLGAGLAYLWQSVVLAAVLVGVGLPSWLAVVLLYHRDASAEDRLRLSLEDRGR